MWGALIGAAADYVFNSRSAERQMNFQEDMANTTYSRAVADMRRAGLNPILAAGGGMQAPSPQGAQPQSPQFANAIARSQELATAKQVADEQVKTMQSQQAANEAAAAKARADTLRTIELVPFEKQLMNEQAHETATRASMSEMQQVLVGLETDKQEVLKSLYTELGPEVISAVRELRGMISSAKSSTSDVIDAVKSWFGANDSSARSVSGKLDAASAENIAITVISDIEQNKKPFSSLGKLSPAVLEKVFEFRPEWRTKK